MDAVLPHHDPEDVVRSPRPGGLLTAAASVPLGAAVLLAAGHLPGGARAVVGVAVVVLGLALLRTHGTVTGARLGPGLSDALGAIVIVLGVGLFGGALAAGIDAGEGGGLGGWGSVLFWIVLAAAAVALLGAPEGGRATMRAAEALLGVAGAVAFVALLGPDAVGLGERERSVVVLVAAAAATGAAAMARTGAGGPRVGIVVAAVLLASIGGEATQLVGTITGHVLPGDDGGDTSTLFSSVRAGAVLLLAGALLVVAARRRNVVGVVLAGALLLTADRTGDGTPAVLVVPVAGLLLTALLVASAPARAAAGALLGRTVRAADDLDDVEGGGGRGDVLSREAALGALAVALVAVASALGGAYDDATGAALAALVLVAGAVALGVALPGPAGLVAAVAALAGIQALQPAVGAASAVWPSTWDDHDTALTIVVAAVHAAAVVALLRRRPEPVVRGLAAVVLAGQAAGVLFAVWSGEATSELAPVLVASLGVPALALVVVAALALVGPARALLPRQAVGAGLAYVAALAAPTLGALAGFDEPSASAPALLQGADRVVAVLLVVVFLLGLALLAASVARRPSVAVTAAVLFGGVQAALYAGVVGAAVRAGATVAPTAPADPLLGFGAASSGVRDSGAAWPLLFGVLGAVLLGAGWWLESRRPLPADAPVGA
jgi:hypothetical protein